MSKKNFYTIRYVSQRTGLTPHVIRAWEKRYAAVVPNRSAKNRRLYCEADVERLQLLKSLTDAGHTISQVAALNEADLTDMANREVSAGQRSAVIHRKILPSAGANAYYKDCLSAVLKLDSMTLESILDQAAIDLTRATVIKDIIEPLFREIGKLWHSGKLKIVNEHMATTVTRTFLMNMLRATAISESAPRIVIATTVGQWHDIGALTVALTAAENGWQPIYYGPNLPAEEIAVGAKQSSAHAVAISITHLLNQRPFIDELRKLRRYIGKDPAIFIGGRSIANYIQVLEEVSAVYIKHIDQFGAELNSLLATHVR